MSDRTGSASSPSPADGALSRCVSQDRQTFAERTWARRPLLSRAAELAAVTHDRPGGAELFSAVAVDELISRRGLRTPFLRMAKQGVVIPPARYTRGGGAGATIADQVADDKVLAELADGATLVLQAMHRVWPPLVEFAAHLSDELGHPVQINAYITPPQNQGFAPHYDTHDVFVLQIAGRKHWRVHEPVFGAPLPEHNWEKRRDAVGARAAETPTIDTVLEPGDALYLPRGYLHSATALGELSIHLTVGIHPVTRRSITRELLAIATEDERLRASLPAGVDLSDPGALADQVRDAAAVLAEILGDLDDAAITRVAGRIGDALVADTRPEPLAPLEQAAVAGALVPSTGLRLRHGLRATTSTTDESFVLRYLDKTVTMPADVEAAVKLVLGGEPFTPETLPGLDAQAQTVLARRLLREGVVVAVDPSAA